MRSSTFALALLAALSQTCIAHAKGTVLVQQVDGSIQQYPNTSIHVVGKTLRLTTADKKGTLIITDAACSYEEKLLRCLPYAMVLKQNGTRPLSVSRGTIYYNPTSVPQPLKYSSMKVPPNGVIASMRTDVGTYVSVTGKLDGRSSQ